MSTFLGVFVCTSYPYGITHGFKTEDLWIQEPPQIPIVLVPEWPLPLNFITPPTQSQTLKRKHSILALLSHPFPYNFKQFTSTTIPEIMEGSNPKTSWESYTEFIPQIEQEPQTSPAYKQRVLVRESEMRMNLLFC